MNFDNYNKIAIVGRPRVGKSTLAERIALDRPIIATDDFIGSVPFGAIPEAVLGAVRARERYIMEGVQTCRLLAHYSFRPDLVIIVDADIPVDPKHAGLATLNKNKINEWKARQDRCRYVIINNKL
jgi:hypothetical protein